MSIYNKLPINMHGHAKAYYEDDPKTLVLDKDNAVHPQNMARIIARALANESNYYVYKMAFGNGGTVVDVAHNITYRAPNTGVAPDLAQWQSRLYNEIYSEIVDDSNILASTGVGAVPNSDPQHASHDPSGPGVTSHERNVISEVVIKCILNENEPISQFNTDLIGIPGVTTELTESAFVFDEIGLFTTGAPLSATHGYQFADVSMRTVSNASGLVAGTDYVFSISIDGGTPQDVSFTAQTDNIAGDVLYGDLIKSLNETLVGCTVSINSGTDIPTDPLLNSNTLTFGYLKFTSDSTGSNSSVNIHDLIRVKAATISNITLAGELTIDGVALSAGDFVLVKNQADPVQNGIYVVAVGAWERATYANTAELLENLTAHDIIYVSQGSVNRATQWNQTATDIILDVTPITFALNNSNWLFHKLDDFIGFKTPTNGENAGVQNDPTNPTNEASRMLTHLIFSPIHKTRNRTLIIEYTLTITVADTVPVTSA